MNNVDQLAMAIHEVLNSLQETEYTCQVQLGFLLKDLSTGQITSFYCSENTGMFENSGKVSKRGDFQKMLHKIMDYNWEDFFSTHKSGMVVDSLT